jgi:GxxExxY protein
MSEDDLIEAELSRAVIGAFFEVYNEMGYGFTEFLHAQGMQVELLSRGLNLAREVPVPVRMKGCVIGEQRMDMVVEDKLIVEIKSTEYLPKTARRQLYNYLRCTDLEVGLLLHFGSKPWFQRQVLSNKNKGASGATRIKRIERIRSLRKDEG